VINDKLLIAISESRKLRRKSVRYPVNAGSSSSNNLVDAAGLKSSASRPPNIYRFGAIKRAAKARSR
jgi:hypothetical protein